MNYYKILTIFYNLPHSVKKCAIIDLPKGKFTKGGGCTQKKIKMSDKIISKLAYRAAERNANSICGFFFYQPSLPEKVKKLRKF